MPNEDTIKLLRQCSEGVKMGISTLDEVIPHAKSENFKNVLTSSKTTHEKLYSEIKELLNESDTPTKNPPMMAQGMAWMKTEMKMQMYESDKTIADIITDGCNTGVKSLTKYLNEYSAAEEKSKEITKRLINSEEKLIECMKEYL